jgi:hypothetical protein
MFQQLIASNPSRASRKPLTLVYSAIIHGFLILLLIAVPLIHPETLANLQMQTAPPPPLSAPRRAIVKLVSGAGKTLPVVTKPNALFSPNFIPKDVDLDSLGGSEGLGSPGEVPQTGLTNGDPLGSNKFLEGFGGTAPRTLEPPEPPVPTERSHTPIRIRQGGDVHHANLVHQVNLPTGSDRHEGSGRGCPGGDH